jgi:hypothetical protein
VGALILWPPTAQGFPWDRYVGWPLTAGLVISSLDGSRPGAFKQRRRVQEYAA